MGEVHASQEIVVPDEYLWLEAQQPGFEHCRTQNGLQDALGPLVRPLHESSRTQAAGAPQRRCCSRQVSPPDDPLPQRGISDGQRGGRAARPCDVEHRPQG
jgi:hypothetical protein